MNRHCYGWVRDSDKRGTPHVPGARNLGDLPRKLDWWERLPSVPPVYDQGPINACVLNVMLRRLRLLRIERDLRDWEPSRMFGYWCARAIQGMQNVDRGCQIRDSLLSLVTDGICLESEWRYDKLLVNWEPPPSCFEVAEKNEVLDYARVDSRSKLDLLDALTIGQVALGIPLYESFESDEVAKTGIIPMPADNERFLGLHAVLITGFDQDDDTAMLDNSWSKDWGQDGRGIIPLDYLLTMADDAWLVK